MGYCRLFAAALSLFLPLSVLASGADGTQPAHHHRHQSVQRATVDAQRRLATHEVEVKQLQQDVAKQELASKQASERLQQQDQSIADLQKQLQEVRSTPPAGHR